MRCSPRTTTCGLNYGPRWGQPCSEAHPAAFTTDKIAALMPVAGASIRIAAAVNPGDWRS
jgi:hypothetical protein